MILTNEDVELRCTRAVAHAKSASKLNTGKWVDGSQLVTDARKHGEYTHKSATERLWRAMTGLCSLMISSTPKLAWKLVSMSSKMAIEPSAPPPLCTRA